MGIKTHIHEMGNLLEFMAIGTAVKRMPNVKTESALLPAQAIIQDKDTWISEQGVGQHGQGQRQQRLTWPSI